MTDIEAIELAIRRVLAAGHLKQGRRVPEYEILEAFADELAKMKPVNYHDLPEPVKGPEIGPNTCGGHGYKLKWVP